MRRTRILGGLVFGGLIAVGITAYAADPHPSALYMEYCAKCHGEDGRGQTPKGKQLMAQDFTDAEWQAEESDAELIQVVTKGDDDMPPFGKKLTKEQIESLVRNDVRGFVKKKASK
ncbi:MAG: cytochrome c [Thermoanaerobaculia bacterium]|nr:cytochrome c [Thermoanaerobaculia bacterium]